MIKLHYNIPSDFGFVILSLK